MSKGFQLTIDSEPEDNAPMQVAVRPEVNKKKRKREAFENAQVNKLNDFANGFTFDVLSGGKNALTNLEQEFFDDSADDVDSEEPEEDSSAESENDEVDLDAAEFEALNGLEQTSDIDDTSQRGSLLSDEEVEETEIDSTYYDRVEEHTHQSAPSFSEIPNAKLSRSILLGLSSMGLHAPTPIQNQTIPCVLLGKDVVGSAVTGSGKTVAFWVGVLERLLYRDKRQPATRVITICPTRELAVQVLNVGKALARYTDITFTLCVGGLSLKVQESELKARPDVVVCTPGRLIDHVRNTPSFSLEAVEILIIDEADRILEEGFADELNEIIQYCPFNRSTLLFSATMNENVADLAKLSLNKPIRIKVDDMQATSSTLVQEFVKVKGEMNAREATLVAVCRKTFTSKTLIFVRSKISAHRLKTIFSLLKMRAEELHGNLSQEQRLKALKKFREAEVDYLIATDLASRGLDIKGIENVINFEMPKSIDIYLHRVGRTARAGQSGRALTLVGESDRRLVKQAIKKAKSVKQRKLEPQLLQTALNEIVALKDDIANAILAEKEEKELLRTEMELRKGENLIKYEADIKGRPARTWFQSERDKMKAKEKGQPEVTSTSMKSSNKRKTLNHKQRRRKEALTEAKEDPKGRSVNASIRSAKKSARPSKIAHIQEAKAQNVGTDKRKKSKKGSSFKTERPRPSATGKKMGKAKSSVSVSHKSKGGSKPLKGGKRSGSNKR